MEWLDDNQLGALVKDPESHSVERKSSGSDRSGIRRNICAFANDLADTRRPGVIFIGIADDGNCAGLTINDSLLQTVSHMHQDGHIMPFPVINVARKTLNGCEVVVLQVAPSTSPPVRYHGRVMVKVGPTVQEASPEDERRLAAKRRGANLPYDHRGMSGSDISDFDLNYIRNRYLPATIPAKILKQNQRDLSQQLRSLRLMTEDEATNGGLLACGTNPQFWIPCSYLQFLRIAGTKISDSIRSNKRLTGKLEDILKQIDALLDINISESLDVTSAPREIRQPDYPLDALRQLAYNAVMHRNYDGTNAPIRLYWYSDRIEILNPGELFGTVTPDTIGTGATEYRNLLIAESMRHLGFAQRFGMGIPMARTALENNGNPPAEFSFEPNLVRVTLRPAS